MFAESSCSTSVHLFTRNIQASGMLYRRDDTPQNHHKYAERKHAFLFQFEKKRQQVLWRSCICRCCAVQHKGHVHLPTVASVILTHTTRLLQNCPQLIVPMPRFRDCHTVVHAA